ncbi:hypothetical protein MKX08_001172 [Trichoderma sp. CBMAI-0020]|nr:hypothetical protein MKX08_001172 [Trichoderma sp. CBMAI-0020]
MGGGSRTFHHKSRNGCSRCKKRRVRCNLQAPSCANCTRRGEVCDYRFLGIDSPQDQVFTPNSHVAYMRRRRHSGVSSRIPPAGSVLPSTSLAPWTQSSADAESIIPASPFGVYSLALSAMREDERNLIQSQLIDQADSSEYIEHNMAAISTLHDKSTDSLLPEDGGNKLELAAYQHHSTASSKFRQSVGAINDRNWFKVLVFAISVLIFHFDIHRRAKRGLSDGEFMEPILALRGAALLGMELGPWLMKSRLLAAIKRRVEGEKPPWDDLAEQAISNLQLINEASSPLQTRAVYRDALNKLQFWLRLSSCKPRTWLHFVWWPGAVDQDYLDLLARKDQMAMVVLVHWCAVMKSSPKKWFMEGWVENVSRPVIPQIGQEWDGVMEWPLSRIRVAASK